MIEVQHIPNNHALVCEAGEVRLAIYQAPHDRAALDRMVSVHPDLETHIHQAIRLTWPEEIDRLGIGG